MKYFTSPTSYFTYGENTKRNLRLVLRFISILAILVTIYSIIFQFLMAYEERHYSWITGLYWTLTAMTTLGFGDITFTSDPGRAFSILVMLSGVIFLLTMLPFIFIRFFYAPWVEAESQKRTPRELPHATKGHVIITNYDPVTIALIEKLRVHDQDYVVLMEDYNQALSLYDEGIRVAVGNIDDPETFKKMRVENAALVVATNRDEINTNISFTVREVSDTVPVITTANSPFSDDILRMAGSNRVLRIYDILGRSLSIWTIGGDCRSNIICRFGELLIAEFSTIGTPLVDKTLAEARTREQFGVTVVGIWERGKFEIPNAHTRIQRTNVLVLAGTEEGLAAYDEVYSFYHIHHLTTEPVIIIGGGRIGTTIAQKFRERDMPYIIIDKNPHRVMEEENFILGDAADLRTLKKALIEKAPAALITTSDDAVNIYLTKYLRSLRADMQILSRATADRNVVTLHRAGADFVMSYTSLGANAIFNFLKKEKTLMLTEGLDIFQLHTPEALIGKQLKESKIRKKTNCFVVAIKKDGIMSINPDPITVIEKDTQLIMIGGYDGERKLLHWHDNA